MYYYNICNRFNLRKYLNDWNITNQKLQKELEKQN